MGHYDSCREDNDEKYVTDETKCCKKCLNFTVTSGIKGNCILHSCRVDDCNEQYCPNFVTEKSCNTCKWNDTVDYDCLNTNIVDCCEPKYEGWEPIKEKDCQIVRELKNPFDYQQGGSHYKIDGCMDVAEWTKKRGHCPYQANIVKYVDRHKKKNGIDDLRKARQYLEFIAYVEYGENL